MAELPPPPPVLTEAERQQNVQEWRTKLECTAIAAYVGRGSTADRALEACDRVTISDGSRRDRRVHTKVHKQAYYRVVDQRTGRTITYRSLSDIVPYLVLLLPPQQQQPVGEVEEQNAPHVPPEPPAQAPHPQEQQEEQQQQQQQEQAGKDEELVVLHPASAASPSSSEQQQQDNKDDGQSHTTADAGGSHEESCSGNTAAPDGTTAESADHAMCDAAVQGANAMPGNHGARGCGTLPAALLAGANGTQGLEAPPHDADGGVPLQIPQGKRQQLPWQQELCQQYKQQQEPQTRKRKCSERKASEEHARRGKRWQSHTKLRPQAGVPTADQQKQDRQAQDKPSAGLQAAGAGPAEGTDPTGAVATGGSERVADRHAATVPLAASGSVAPTAGPPGALSTPAPPPNAGGSATDNAVAGAAFAPGDHSEGANGTLQALLSSAGAALDKEPCPHRRLQKLAELSTHLADLTADGDQRQQHWYLHLAKAAEVAAELEALYENMQALVAAVSQEQQQPDGQQSMAEVKCSVLYGATMMRTALQVTLQEITQCLHAQPTD